MPNFNSGNNVAALNKMSGLGTGIATALAINVGSAGSIIVNGGALGTPSSGTLSSCTGLPISSGISGLAAGIATFLTAPSSANLAAAVTDESGTGALLFAGGNIGAATGTSLAVSGALTSSSPSAGIGYATGAGGTVTQSTSKSTGVTINKLCGTIVTSNAALNSGDFVVFTVTNSSVAATDFVRVGLVSGSTNDGAYSIERVSTAAGSFKVSIWNRWGAASSLSEALTIDFLVTKSVAS